jgi:hypothetical protein
MDEIGRQRGHHEYEGADDEPPDRPGHRRKHNACNDRQGPRNCGDSKDPARGICPADEDHPGKPGRHVCRQCDEDDPAIPQDRSQKYPGEDDTPADYGQDPLRTWERARFGMGTRFPPSTGTGFPPSTGTRLPLLPRARNPPLPNTDDHQHRDDSERAKDEHELHGLEYRPPTPSYEPSNALVQPKR